MVEEKPNVKNQLYSPKFFAKKDVIIYAIIAVCLILSFILVPVLLKTKNAMGFSVSKDGKTVFTYNLLDDEIIFSNDDDILISKIESDGKVKIKLSYANGTFNELVIDKANGYISVNDSSCKNSTCVHSGKLKDKGAILCIPNGLKITPIADDSLILGGGA
ncbi:MAG: NusG domain II-containing protein [Clostridia bacterium]|nr:NusG domain II-containing protein [Clostridia bacterium]